MFGRRSSRSLAARESHALYIQTISFLKRANFFYLNRNGIISSVYFEFFIWFFLHFSIELWLSSAKKIIAKIVVIHSFNDDFELKPMIWYRGKHFRDLTSNLDDWKKARNTKGKWAQSVTITLKIFIKIYCVQRPALTSIKHNVCICRMLDYFLRSWWDQVIEK